MLIVIADSWLSKKMVYLLDLRVLITISGNVEGHPSLVNSYCPGDRIVGAFARRGAIAKF
jgi:hypothetical protein